MEVTQSGAQLVVKCLEAQGVEHVFCIPGAKIDKLLDCLADSKIQTHVCRHEQNAALIAQGIGRMTGKAGVCLVTSGPGCTNLATGLVTATYEGDPVVALGGAVPLADRLKLTHQSLDTVNLFKPITKLSAEITAPQAIPEAIAAAFRAAENGRPGAAFLALPKDVMDNPAPFDHCRRAPRPQFGPAEPTAIIDAARQVNLAQRPVVLIGMMASAPPAADALRMLLKKTPLPIVCTYEGAGVTPRELLHCFAGRVGLSRNQPGDWLLDAADLIIAVGYDPVEYDPGIWNSGKQRPIIHIDTTPAEIDASYWPAIELIGDTASTLGVLSQHLKPNAVVDSMPELGSAVRELAQAKARGAALNGSPVHPLRLIKELQEIATDDTTVICDVGSLYMWMSRYFLSFRPRQFLTSNGQQTLGVAMPWAIAACLVRPSDKVLSMSGDGGFLFSGQELDTAVRLKCNFVHLVWDDHCYNMVKIQQLPKYGRETAVELGRVDFVQYAEAFGATGMRIDSPDQITPVLRKALDTPGPVIVHVPVDYSDNAKLFESVRTHAVH